MVDWHDAVSAVVRQGFGWLLPGGDILPCGLHNHLDAVRSAGHYVAEIDELDTLTPDAVERNCEMVTEMLGSSNAEWHRLDYAAEDFERARRCVVDTMYAAGWVRLGTYRPGGILTIQAEGSPVGLARAESNLSDLATAADASLSVLATASETAVKNVFTAARR